MVAGIGGLWFAVWKTRQSRWARAVEREAAFSPNVFLAVDEDETVTIWITKTEMGQGVMTGLAMIVAEELKADWSQVEVKLATLDGQYDYGNMYTAASGSTSSLWSELRRAGAAAREMLVEAGSARWRVNASDCFARSGNVVWPKGDKTLSYGQLAHAAAALTPPLRPTLTLPSQFQLIGRELPRVDVPDKVTGAAVYGIDIRLDNTLRAGLLRCPVRGGLLAEVAVENALKVDGVTQVLQFPSAVAVLGRSTWSVKNGLDSLSPRWDFGSSTHSGNVEFLQKLESKLLLPGIIAKGSGDVAFSSQELSQRANYHVPFLAHATMEPMNCSVELGTEGVQIWTSTQNPDAVRDLAARILDLPLEKCVVQRTLVGGGFGRRTNPDEVEEALTISKRINASVQLVWSREDDIKHDFYREAAAHSLAGSLSSGGEELSLFHRIASASPALVPGLDEKVEDTPLMGAVDIPYKMQKHRVEWHGVSSPIRIGIWRSVGYSHNVFAIESFIDQLASSRNLDPLALRRQLLDDSSRLKPCLDAVAKMANWSQKPKADSALGVALCSCFGSHVAQIAEVRKVNDSPRVTRVWCALDCGINVNPNSVRAQVEGGVIFGLTAALHGRISLNDGSVRESNFDDYPLLRQSETPEIFIQILANDHAPSGVGELAVPAIAPAVANAWARLTGKRWRRLPLSSAQQS